MEEKNEVFKKETTTEDKTEVSIETIISNLKKIFPAFLDLESQMFEVNKLSMGLSSKVFKVTITDKIKEKHNYVYKHFVIRDGFNLENRIRETKNFEAIAEKNLGPRNIFSNTEYRIEEYIDSSPVLAKEINDIKIRKILALRLGGIHCLTNMPVPNGTFIETLLQNTAIIEKFKLNLNDKEKFKSDVKRQKTIERAKDLLSKEEVDYINNQIKNMKLVYSHNDIWCGNVIVTKDKKDAYLIDYEKVGYNVRSYDIAKLICETMYVRDENGPGYTLVKENFPSKDDINDFLKYYYLGYSQLFRICDVIDYINNNQNNNNNFDSITKALESIEAKSFVDELFKELNAGYLLVGYYTAILGIFIGDYTGFGMDFMEFAHDGLDIYFDAKNKLM